jgi:hypothetical protein
VEKEEQKIDWTYLPEGITEVSLWDCLHDGELISCHSNLPERTVALEFSVKHLVDEKDSDLRFFVKVEGVTAVRATGTFRPVGKFEDPQNIKERARLLKEYHGKWREESVSWSVFESAVETDTLEVGDAGYVSNTDQVALRLGGFINGEHFDDIYFHVFLRGKALVAARSDGKAFNLDAFIELGRNYWNEIGS